MINTDNSSFRAIAFILSGFPIHFSARGGNRPPTEGGDSRGGIRSGRGGNAAWNIPTIGLNSIVYLMVIWRQIFSLKTSYNIAWGRIFHKLDYCKHVNSPLSGKKFLRRGARSKEGWLTSIVLCPPLNWKPCSQAIEPIEPDSLNSYPRVSHPLNWMACLSPD